MNAYLAPLAIVALTLGTGSALAAAVPGYLEPGYLNYHYPRQTQAASTVQLQPNGSYVEPGYLNYGFAPAG